MQEAGSRRQASTGLSRFALRARADLRDRAIRAERELHHRRTRLLSASSRRGWPRGVRRNERTGADDGRRGKDARLLHQPDRFCRAPRRRAAAADRPGVQRNRLCAARHYAERGEPSARGLGGRRRRAADHRSAGGSARRASRFRRRAGRQHRAHGRGHGCGPCRRELGPRRAIVHLGRPARRALAFLSSRSRRLCSRRTFRSA